MKREERANGIHTGAADTYRTGGTKDDGATNAFRSDNGLKADSAANAFRSGGYAPEAIVTKEDVAAPFSAQSVRALLPDDDTIYSLAELFKMFGDPTRAKILGCLQVRGLCVGEIAEVLGMSVSAVSHQLRILRGAKLVKAKKEGKEVRYSLDDDHVNMIMECGLTHVNEDK